MDIASFALLIQLHEDGRGGLALGIANVTKVGKALAATLKFYQNQSKRKG